MIPLIFANLDEEVIIKKVGGNADTKQHLSNLGFIPGARVSLVATNGGNVIVNVLDSRIAISKELAQKIMY